MIAGAPILPAGSSGAARAGTTVRISTLSQRPPRRAPTPGIPVSELAPCIHSSGSSAELPEPASGVNLKATRGPQVSPRRTVVSNTDWGRVCAGLVFP